MDHSMVSNGIFKFLFFIFISIDKIASYIRSIFNYGTLKEEDQNPILPLKYFANNWNLPSIYSIYNYLFITNIYNIYIYIYNYIYIYKNILLYIL